MSLLNRWEREAVELSTKHYIRKFTLLQFARKDMFIPFPEEELSPGFIDKLLQNEKYTSSIDQSKTVYENVLCDIKEEKIKEYFKDSLDESQNSIDWMRFFKWIQEKEPIHHDKFLNEKLWEIHYKFVSYRGKYDQFDEALQAYKYRVDSDKFKEAEKEFSTLNSS
jgi:hypothetical protein